MIKISISWSAILMQQTQLEVGGVIAGNLIDRSNFLRNSEE